MTEPKHTAATLAALDDAALATLAANIVGYQSENWRPATDANQALGLLDWAAETANVGFTIVKGGRREVLADFRGNVLQKEFLVRVPGDSSRAMTIAFVLAMQEVDK